MADAGMKNDSGLALYEPWEADLCVGLFYPASAGSPNEPTWKRLKTNSYYIALRYNQKISRDILQTTPWKITNPKTRQWVMAFLVDYGPGESTNRLVDMSPGLAAALRVETDDLVSVEGLI